MNFDIIWTENEYLSYKKYIRQSDIFNKHFKCY